MAFQIATPLSNLFGYAFDLSLCLEDNLELQPRFSLARQVHATPSVEAKSFSCSSQFVTALPARAEWCTSPLFRMADALRVTE